MDRRPPQRWQWPSLDETAESTDAFQPASAGAVTDAPGDEDNEGAEQARRQIEEKHRRAEELLEQARTEAQDIRKSARQAAWAEALAEAREQLADALEETVREQTEAFERAREALVEQVEDAAAERMEQVERQAAGLVAAMAEKVIHRKVESEDGIVVDVVRATIEEAAGANRFVVRVSPPDEDLAREAMAELLTVAEGAEELEIVPDEAIECGGCIVETERGRFDARIATQIELLGDEIERALGGGGSE